MAPAMAWSRRVLAVVAVLCLLSSHVVGRIGIADSELDRRRGSTGDRNLEQDVTSLGVVENRGSDSSRIYAQQDLKLETHGEVIHSIGSRYLLEEKAVPANDDKVVASENPCRFFCFFCFLVNVHVNLEMMFSCLEHIGFLPLFFGEYLSKPNSRCSWLETSNFLFVKVLHFCFRLERRRENK